MQVFKLSDGLQAQNTSAPQDDFSGDISTTASLSIGNLTLSGSLETFGDDDWVAIDIELGETFEISLNGTGDAALEDPFLRLYDNTGRLIAQNDDVVLNSQRDSALSFTASESGTYYISARAFGDNSLGDYTISAQRTQSQILLNSINWGADLAADDGETTIINVFFQTEQLGVLDTFGRVIDALSWTEYEIEQALLVLEEISDVLDVDFVRVDNAEAADFRFIVEDNTSDPGNFGFFFPPEFGEHAGTGVFNRSGRGWDEGGISDGGGLERGGFGYVTLVHEISHGLGLAHPHDRGGESTLLSGLELGGELTTGLNGETVLNLGDFDLNQSVFTIQSFVDGYASGEDGVSNSEAYGYQATLAPLDIALLQQIYGARETTNAGTTIYRLSAENTSGTAYETIYDTSGDDAIVGTAGDDIINLNAATLRLEEGGGGSVSSSAGVFGGFTIAAGTQIERAGGAAGNDHITGNDGDNLLAAGLGDDVVNAGGGNDIVFDGLGADVINLGEGDDHLNVGGGQDSYDGGEGQDLISYHDSAGGIVVDLAANTIDGSWATNDEIRNFESVIGSDTGVDVIYGTNGANVLQGGGGDDLLSGRDGDDVLYGGRGNDRIFDGAGNDLVTLGDGDDYVRVGTGSNEFFGGDGDDYISYFDSHGGVSLDLALNTASGGLAEDDIISGFESASGSGQGADILRGTDGVNDLRSYGGDDILEGRGGDDILTGGSGADQFIFSDGFGDDIIRDFEAGQDRLDFSNLSDFTDAADVLASATQLGNSVVIQAGDNSVTLQGVELSELNENDFVFDTMV